MEPDTALPATAMRVTRNTPPDLNARLEHEMDVRLAQLQHADRAALDARLDALGREWDIERVLQTNASSLLIAGSVLAMAVDRRFLLLPGAVLSFLLQHALQGWCPPIPLFRRRGVRTAREIARECYAVKALRGDFDKVPARGTADPADRARAALAAADA